MQPFLNELHLFFCKGFTFKFTFFQNNSYYSTNFRLLMKRLFFFTLFYLFVYLTFAAHISGIITDSKTAKAIEFASVGFVNKNIGSVSDEKGFYEFSAENISDNDTFLVSMIGYTPKMMKYSEAKTKMKDGKLNISLTPQEVQLPTVEIRAKDSKYATLGHKGSDNISAGFHSNALGTELAMKMNVKGSYNVLKKLKIHIANSELDSLAFRVNIYDLKKGMPNTNILKRNIIVRTNQKKGEVVVDLTPYNIVVTQDFAIGLEWIKDYGGKKDKKDKLPLTFKAGFINGKSYFRDASQGKWGDAPINVGFEVETLYYK